MDLRTRIWERVDAGPGPGPRYFHSMDVWEDKLVCFGGMSDSDPMSVHNDIWFFDCISRKWIPQPSPSDDVSLGIDSAAQDQALIPSARYAHLSSVSRGKLVISGGQHSDNTWIYEINVYDLKSGVWISKTEQPQSDGMYSKGAYRSIATSSKKRVQRPQQGGHLKSTTAHTYSVDEEGEGGGEQTLLHRKSFHVLTFHQISGVTPTMTLPKFDVNSISSLPKTLNTSLPISTRRLQNSPFAMNLTVCVDHLNPQVFASLPEVSSAIHSLSVVSISPPSLLPFPSGHSTLKL